MPDAAPREFGCFWQPVYGGAQHAVGGRGWQGIRQAAGAGLRRDACPSSLLWAVHAAAMRFFSAFSSSCSDGPPVMVAADLGCRAKATTLF